MKRKQKAVNKKNKQLHCRSFKKRSFKNKNV